MALNFLKKARDLMSTLSLRYLLHQHMSGHQPGRGWKRVHASEVTKEGGVCPRLYALADVAGIKTPDEWLSTSQNLTFDIGRMVQDKVVHQFADMGKCIGHWKCLACEKLHEFSKRPYKCTKCGCKGFKAEEVRFTSAVSGVSCGVDMLLALDGKKLTPVEIKTIAPEAFKELLAPLGEHRLRSNLYCRIISEDTGPWAQEVDTTAIRILYVTKGGWGTTEPLLKTWGMYEQHSPFKEFPITRDDTQTEAVLKAAIIVKQFRDKEIGMPKGVCSSSMQPRAKYCAAKGPCWSGEFPPEFTGAK